MAENQRQNNDFKGVDRNQYENYQKLSSTVQAGKRPIHNSNSNSPF